jgi:predicted transglutaminase-like cysteine proteinase
MNARCLGIVSSGLVLVASVGFATSSPMCLDEGGPAGAPFAHTRFCLRYPDECRKPGNDRYNIDASTVYLSPAMRGAIKTVNTLVNARIEPRRQSETAATEDWVINPAVGDCNDYAVTKRHMLIKKGVPARALRLTEVSLKSGEHHLVLIVRTNEGDLVLDNLEWKIRTVAQANADFRWVRMESAQNPLFWTTIRMPS